MGGLLHQLLPEEPEDEKRPTGPPVPRLLGVGLIDVARMFRNDQEEHDDAVTIWSVSDRSEEQMDERNALVAAFLSTPSSPRFGICKKVSRINFSIKAFTATDSDSLIRNNPTSMHLVSKCQKMGFSEAPSKSRSDIYLTLSKAVHTSRCPALPSRERLDSCKSLLAIESSTHDGSTRCVLGEELITAFMFHPTVQE